MERRVMLYSNAVVLYSLADLARGVDYSYVMFRKIARTWGILEDGSSTGLCFTHTVHAVCHSTGACVLLSHVNYVLATRESLH